MKTLALLIAVFCSVQLMAQCYPDRHNTSWNDAWYSCQESDNPNSERGSGHWIMYDLRNEYKLGQGKLWNINAPDRLSDGFHSFAVDYSMDAENWETLGEYIAAEGPGDPLYEGEELFNFAGDSARYVLLTALSNYGGDCYGIAEMRIDVIDLVTSLNQTQDECLYVSVYPNPHESNFNLNVGSFCIGPIYYQLYNSVATLIKQGVLPENGVENFQVSTAGVPSGVYYLVVTQNGNSKQTQIVKINN
ncbi:MAG: discoidin domain-containing protein [Cryomorphaceae bacterium]